MLQENRLPAWSSGFSWKPPFHSFLTDWGASASPFTYCSKVKECVGVDYQQEGLHYIGLKQLRTVLVQWCNVQKLKGYLESLCSLEELGKLVLSHIHLTSIHELQDGCQVLRKRKYRIAKGTKHKSNMLRDIKEKCRSETWKGTSFRMMMGCLAGFSSSSACGNQET